jgi:hypothetical protein
MTRIRMSLTALAFGLVAMPALAGGIAFDLPRLDFPAPTPDATRACTLSMTAGCMSDGQ